MRRMIRHAAKRATSTALRQVDVALCRAIARRMTAPCNRPTEPVRIVHRTTADLGALELHELTPEQVLEHLRRIGWGSER